MFWCSQLAVADYLFVTCKHFEEVSGGRGFGDKVVMPSCRGSCGPWGALCVLQQWQRDSHSHWSRDVIATRRVQSVNPMSWGMLEVFQALCAPVRGRGLQEWGKHEQGASGVLLSLRLGCLPCLSGGN